MRTAPSVWVKACTKTAKCQWCAEPIANNTYMVVVMFLRGKWRIKRYYHPDCWIQQAIAALEKRGKVENRGRKKLPLPDEVRAKRGKILSRRASVVQRIRATTDAGKLVHLGIMLEKLKEEIECVGGAPTSW